MDIKDFMPVLTFIVGIFTLWISWMNYKSQRESKPPELARLESWSKLMQDAGVELSKIDNKEYIQDLSKAQKNLIDNYNIFFHRASLEPMLNDIGVSDGKAFNKLMSMSKNQNHIKDPGFNNYASNCLRWWYISIIILIIAFLLSMFFCCFLGWVTII